MSEVNYFTAGTRYEFRSSIKDIKIKHYIRKEARILRVVLKKVESPEFF